LSRLELETLTTSIFANTGDLLVPTSLLDYRFMESAFSIVISFC